MIKDMMIDANSASIYSSNLFAAECKMKSPLADENHFQPASSVDVRVNLLNLTQSGDISQEAGSEAIQHIQEQVRLGTYIVPEEKLAEKIIHIVKEE